MKAATILALKAENCSAKEIALALGMDLKNVEQVIRHCGWKRHSAKRTRDARALRLLVGMRA